MPDSLQIAGLQRLSTVDWPGKLAAVAFLQGCPWACTYCHNTAIIDCAMPGMVSWDDVRTFLSRRRGLLDGMVFSGGEATRQPALLPAVRQTRELGFAVGLHTAGAFPNRLRELLDQELVDWVGLDIKATPVDYQSLTGSPVAAEKAEKALEILLSHDVDYEVRMTLWKGGIDYAVAVAQWCLDRGVKQFALQRLVESPSASLWKGPTPQWEKDEALVRLGALGFDHVAVR
ncbi:anaerobic ribonucleoside-triphosphate reductase activating protein [Actinomycetaceae bacterium WB03_NA08]|uniref:Anaerobic ribonucleoside-triphosphate reductase activating protein n=1 Tax=Scrofimicrobium canadense TaxID=2652290 RepID=A0A6N7VNP8_9ACTO|nr:anaerobic ribonucleoside-triphosphate reductase activating protein [Scrofimicrobium canadense]MSS83317.1 anaerobic ribonucleoside-triphosphate reductase activating protein [Scrofimicrobium canadense]